MILPYGKWNDLDGALEAITQGIAQGEQTGNTDFLCDGYPILMSVSLARGSLLEAQTALARAEEVARKRDIALKYGYIATARASLWSPSFTLFPDSGTESVNEWQEQPRIKDIAW